MPVLNFNRRVDLQHKTVMQDEMGTPIETWTTARSTRADRRDITGLERMRAQQEVATRTSLFTIRWFQALTAGDWRIIHDGLIWDIEGIAELPNTRHQYWQLTATATGV